MNHFNQFYIALTDACAPSWCCYSGIFGMHDHLTPDSLNTTRHLLP